MHRRAKACGAISPIFTSSLEVPWLRYGDVTPYRMPESRSAPMRYLRTPLAQFDTKRIERIAQTVAAMQ